MEPWRSIVSPALPVALLDTSFLFALANSNDRNHQRVVEAAQGLSGSLLLPVPVLPEVCYLLASRLGHGAMRRFLRELAASNIGLEPIDRVDLERVNELLAQYADSHLDFVDAALVAIAERYGVTRILTLDRRDFGMIRPKHCDHFDLVP
ncbi:MAG: PIN domain-containing protein [Anaerolineaceae bacterium]|nr:PIN domain-containing protein [Anaerolineaceae bacterium]